MTREPYPRAASGQTFSRQVVTFPTAVRPLRHACPNSSAGGMPRIRAGLQPPWKTANVACSRFFGHEDKSVTDELENGCNETDVQPRVEIKAVTRAADRDAAAGPTPRVLDRAFTHCSPTFNSVSEPTQGPVSPAPTMRHSPFAPDMRRADCIQYQLESADKYHTCMQTKHVHSADGRRRRRGKISTISLNSLLFLKVRKYILCQLSNGTLHANSMAATAWRWTICVDVREWRAGWRPYLSP